MGRICADSRGSLLHEGPHHRAGQARESEFLKESGDRFQKAIVFCVDTEHAARMRQAVINGNADLVQQNVRYVMCITGDGAEGCDQIGTFIDPEATYPVLVTTSRLLSTGVDARTCRIIVIDRTVGSMTEFKQIVGLEPCLSATLSSPSRISCGLTELMGRAIV